LPHFDLFDATLRDHFKALVRQQKSHGSAALAAVQPVAQLEGVIKNDDAPFCEQNKNK
jgi:hypothetical protein